MNQQQSPADIVNHAIDKLAFLADCTGHIIRGNAPHISQRGMSGLSLILGDIENDLSRAVLHIAVVTPGV